MQEMPDIPGHTTCWLLQRGGGPTLECLSVERRRSVNQRITIFFSSNYCNQPYYCDPLPSEEKHHGSSSSDSLTEREKIYMRRIPKVEVC